MITITDPKTTGEEPLEDCMLLIDSTATRATNDALPLQVLQQLGYYDDELNEERHSYGR